MCATSPAPPSSISKALAPLGYGIVMQVSAEETGDGAAVGFGAQAQKRQASFWIGEGEPASGPMHVAFVAPTRAAVDAFYRAAINAGGKDNGEPGLRPEYHANYYGAFVLRPRRQQCRGGLPHACVNRRSSARAIRQREGARLGRRHATFSPVFGSFFVS